MISYMAGTFSRSFQLVKESFAVLKKDKEIMWFPIISSIVTVLLFISFLIPVYFLTDIKTEGITNNYLYYILFFAYYLLSYFIVIFFNTGLITCAHVRLNGGDPTFSDGFKNARKHIGKIFVWALISATVGLILRTIADKSKTLGRIVTAIIGMIWSLLTFFVIPVMIFENLSVIQSIKKSAHLFKKTWGENVIGQFSMGVFFMVLALIGIIPLIMSFFTFSFILVILTASLVIIYWVILGIISSSLSGIFVTALYTYANTGKVPSVYSQAIIMNAFRPKISRGVI